MELDIFRLDDGAFAERANRRSDPEMQIPERAGELGNGGLAGGFRGFIFEEEEEVNIRTGEKHAAAITAGCCDTSFHGRNGGETMFHKLSDDAVSEPAAPGQRCAPVAGGLKRPADVRGFFCAELSEIRKRNDGRHANRSAPGAARNSRARSRRVRRCGCGWLPRRGREKSCRRRFSRSSRISKSFRRRMAPDGRARPSRV